MGRIFPGRVKNHSSPKLRHAMLPAPNSLRSVTWLLLRPVCSMQDKRVTAARAQLNQVSGGRSQWSETAVQDKTPVTERAEEFFSAGKVVKQQTFSWWAGKLVATVTRGICDKIWKHERHELSLQLWEALAFLQISTSWGSLVNFSKYYW